MGVLAVAAVSAVLVGRLHARAVVRAATATARETAEGVAAHLRWVLLQRALLPARVETALHRLLPGLP